MVVLRLLGCRTYTPPLSTTPPVLPLSTLLKLERNNLL
jgi:hypothetical protein